MRFKAGRSGGIPGTTSRQRACRDLRHSLGLPATALLNAQLFYHAQFSVQSGGRGKSLGDNSKQQLIAHAQGFPVRGRIPAFVSGTKPMLRFTEKTSNQLR